MDTVLLRHQSEHLESLPVGTVYCVGLNYADHAAEMKSTRPEEPLIFIKPASSLVTGNQSVTYPAITNELHHEVELVVCLNRGGRNLTLGEAENAVLAYGLGLDLTLRDRQAEAKAKGRPWSVAKGFAQSAPVSTLQLAPEGKLPQSLDFKLLVNGEPRQQGNTDQMLFSVPELIVYLSTVFELRRGDLIYTGTPAGVSALQRGDMAEAWLGEQTLLCCEII